jgi:guanine nucleotide-binding protein subunit alpha
MDTEPLSVLPQEILHSIESLWHDPVIPSVMDRSSEFYLMDSATYFFANIRKIGAADYVPDEADVLRARTKTTGISETRFNMGQLSIHMFDVGGQRSERKKWIHCELPLYEGSGRCTTDRQVSRQSRVLSSVSLLANTTKFCWKRMAR